MAKIIFVCKELNASVLQHEDGSYFVRKGAQEMPARINISQGHAPTLSVQMGILAKKRLLGYKITEENVVVFFQRDPPAQEQQVIPATPPPQQQKGKSELSAMLKSAIQSGCGVKMKITEGLVDDQMRTVRKPITEIAKFDPQMAVKKAQMESEQRLKQHSKVMLEKLGQLETETKLGVAKIETATATQCETIRQDIETMEKTTELNLREMKANTDNHLEKVAAQNEKARVQAEETLTQAIITHQRDLDVMEVQNGTKIKAMQEENRTKEATANAELARVIEARNRDYAEEEGKEKRMQEERLTTIQIESKRVVETGNQAHQIRMTEMRASTDEAIAIQKDKHSQMVTELANALIKDSREQNEVLSQQTRELTKKTADFRKQQEADSLKSDAQISELRRAHETRMQDASNQQALREQEMRQNAGTCSVF